MCKGGANAYLQEEENESMHDGVHEQPEIGTLAGMSTGLEMGMEQAVSS